MALVKTTAKGQVVIPADIRKKYRISKGTKVKIEDENGRIILKPLLNDPVKNARGVFKDGKSALKFLLEDRSKEAKK